MFASLLRRENETLAEKYKNAQASLNSTLSLKARSVHLLHVHTYIHLYVLSNLICDAVEAHSCVDIVAKFTDEQYTTINQSTAGRFDPRVFVNCLQVNCL